MGKCQALEAGAREILRLEVLWPHQRTTQTQLPMSLPALLTGIFLHSDEHSLDTTELGVVPSLLPGE